MGKYDIPLELSEDTTTGKLMAEIIPGSTVLEFGCASGRMTRYLSETLHCSVHIVELSNEDYEIAKQYAVSGFCGDIDTMGWVSYFQSMQFDVILFADVLEHLKEPEKILAAAAQFLKKDGKVVISIPNIAHCDILANLFLNKFQYTPLGLLDNTHIHFWGYQDLEPFAEAAGLTITLKDAVYAPLLGTEQKVDEEQLPTALKEILQSRPMNNVYQFFLVMCHKAWAKENHITPKNRIQMEQDNIAHLYFDFGYGWDSEYYLSARNTAMDTSTFSFTFDMNGVPAETIRYIRFDPCENSSSISIHNISGVRGEMSIRPLNAYSGANDVFFTNDPMYLIMSDNFADIQSITIEGQIKPLEITDLWFSALSVLEDIRLRESQKADMHFEEKNSMQKLTNELKNRMDNIQNQMQHLQEMVTLAVEKVDQDKTILTLNQLENKVNLTENQLQNLHAQLCSQKSKIEDFTKVQQKIQHDVADNIYMNQCMMHTVTDIHYVLNNTPWYKKTLKHIGSSNKLNGLAFLKTQMKKIANTIISKLYCASKGNALIKAVLQIPYSAVKLLCPSLGKTLQRKFFTYRQLNMTPLIDSVSRQDQYVTLTPWCYEKKKEGPYQPLVSIIVPNYNHEAYLVERLESIYHQTYQNYEVILLDDCSSDNSRDILINYANRYPKKTIVDFNEQNGGKVFKQWNKGIAHAKGDLIWIAESDDWCELDFLEKMVPQFQYDSVMLAFARSVFMQNGQQIWTLEEYLQDLPLLDLSKPFTVSAHSIVANAFAYKNVIPNVSSALFRNTGIIPTEITDIWKNIRLCGDWLFYLHTIKGGTISYTNETTNYYRVHKNSTSLNVQKTAVYYEEQEQISRFVAENFKVDLSVFDVVQKNLEAHYKALNNTEDVSLVAKKYRIDAIVEASKNKKPNVIMCGYSLEMGGGETYPIFLANEMKEQGIPVTFLNMNLGKYSEEVRGLLRADVPLITLEHPDGLGAVLSLTGADIVHSHHASVDQIVSTWLDNTSLNCKQVVSLHGMYETMDQVLCSQLFAELEKTCSQFVYTAEKNIQRIREIHYEDKIPLIKIGNALPEQKIVPIDRASMGIGDEDFVLCLVSRALKEKGWQEAVDAVIAANKRSQRKIHLILIGGGPMQEVLSDLNLNYIHLLGQKTNIRDYFAMADIGFLPSRFTGESFPLVVIDCLMAGKPVLASDVGEIRNQLLDEDNNLAGMLFSLKDWTIDVQDLTDRIIYLSENREEIAKLCSRVSSAKDKFNISKIVKEYLAVYRNVL